AVRRPAGARLPRLPRRAGRCGRPGGDHRRGPQARPLPGGRCRGAVRSRVHRRLRRRHRQPGVARRRPAGQPGAAAAHRRGDHHRHGPGVPGLRPGAATRRPAEGRAAYGPVGRPGARRRLRPRLDPVPGADAGRGAGHRLGDRRERGARVLPGVRLLHRPRPAVPAHRAGRGLGRPGGRLAAPPGPRGADHRRGAVAGRRTAAGQRAVGGHRRLAAGRLHLRHGAATVTTGYVNTPARRALAFARNTWRGLTSMRTALILLFLLALAALPGAMLPQYSLNTPKVDAYIAEHGWWGELLGALGFFEVYSSAWFSAIYLLLMVSIVGCLLPRFLEYYRALRAEPVLTPRNLSRLPHFRTATVDGTPEEVLARAKQRLRGWRMVERTEDGGASISAERGYLREAG